VVVHAEGWEAALQANKRAFIDNFVRRSGFLNAYPQAMSPRSSLTP